MKNSARESRGRERKEKKRRYHGRDETTDHSRKEFAVKLVLRSTFEIEKRQICFFLLKRSGVKSKSSKKETECCSTSLLTPTPNFNFWTHIIFRMLSHFSKTLDSQETTKLRH
ncbi:uncharacterized protein LOC144302674 [Canis aureus]